MFVIIELAVFLASPTVSSIVLLELLCSVSERNIVVCEPFLPVFRSNKSVRNSARISVILLAGSAPSQLRTIG